MTRNQAIRAAVILGSAGALGMGIVVGMRHSCSPWVPMSCSGPDPELVKLVR